MPRSTMEPRLVSRSRCVVGSTCDLVEAGEEVFGDDDLSGRQDLGARGPVRGELLQPVLTPAIVKLSEELSSESPAAFGSASCHSARRTGVVAFWQFGMHLRVPAGR
jgi:hypothetical protein